MRALILTTTLASTISALLVALIPTPATAACPYNFQPVCGVDGQRYANACVAKGACAAIEQGGALIEISDLQDGTLFFWSTNDAFIDEAIAIANGDSPQRIPVLSLHSGSYCTQPHGFYPDPQNMSWADVTTEVCDATLSYIDENLDAWLNEVGQWCPWSSEVRSVWDYR